MATPPTDYYSLLGLQPSATTEAVRNAYKAAAMTHHPDRGGSPALWAQISLAYDTLSDLQKRAIYDRSKTETHGGAERQFAQKFGEGSFDTSAPPSRAGRKAGMSILKQMEEVKKDEERVAAVNRTAVVASGFSMSHSAGFEAWMRNQKGMGQHGFYTADDLLRESKAGTFNGMIEATGATATPLPTLSALAIRFERHGPPEEVLRLEHALRMPEQLAYGEVLVYWLAASVTEEDLLRVQTPLTILNNFPPFNRTKQKWEEIRLPATAGGEGVGIVLATAKDVPSVKLDDADEVAKAVRSLPGMHANAHALEVKDWVIALPDARRAPVGCWSSLSVVPSERLLKVPAQLLPLQHYACSRALCTAYRLLEDYGSLRPGDTLIQNAADLPVGQAVIQLCTMLKIRTINLVPDDAGFERSKELLMQLGATHVLRDNSKLAEFLEALGSEMPRLALDSLGGDAGRRLAIALRPGGTLVVHSMQSGQVPQLSPSLIMYQQISLYGFNLSQWVSENGSEAYLAMLRTLAELVQADRLNLYTRTLKAEDLDGDSLAAALASHRMVQDGRTIRERSVFLFGSEAAANDLYFDISTAIRKLERGLDEENDPLSSPPVRAAPSSGTAASGATGSGPRASERWADALEMLREIDLPQYIANFEEEEMTSMALLEDIVSRADGEKELMEALKEMGIKKMGHRQTIVGAVLGKL